MVNSHTIMSKPTGNPPGRPPKYKTPEEMSVVIDAYFAGCDKGKTTERYDNKRKTVVKIKEPTPYTMERLSVFLGFSGVTSLWEYNKKAGFTELLIRARSIIAAEMLEGTMSGRYPPQIAPFRLCNMDKKNYQSINQGQQINIGIGLSEAPKKLTAANMRLKQVKGKAKALPTPKKTAHMLNKGHGD